MGIDCGGYRRTWADVSSGQLVKCPASMAAHQVEARVKSWRRGKNTFCLIGVVDDGIGSAGCAGDLGGVRNGQWRC